MNESYSDHLRGSRLKFKQQIKNAITTQRVMDIYDEIVKVGILEDRREYDMQMLRYAYPSLSDREILDLFYMIQCNFMSDL